MLNNQVSFKGEQKKPSFLSSVKNTAVSVGKAVVNVGAAATAGGVAGAAVGKVVSYVPYKASEAAIKFQYADMFIKAAANTATPEHLKLTGKEALDLVAEGRQLGRAIIKHELNHPEAEDLLEILNKMKDKKFKDPEFQSSLYAFFKDNADAVNANIQKNGGYAYTKEQAMQKCEKIVQEGKNLKETFFQKADEFAGKIADMNNPKLSEMAKSGAKHLRNQCIAGICIGAGIIAALTLNFLIINGIIGRKKPKAQDKANEPTKPSVGFMPKLKTHQG